MKNLLPVSYVFHVHCKKDLDFTVRHIKLTEHLSEPYEALIDVEISQDISIGDLLGRDATVCFGRTPLTHHRWRGIIDRASYTAATSRRRALWHVRLVPAVAAMKRTAKARVYQNKNAIEVIREVLGEGLSAYGREHQIILQHRIEKDFPALDFCIQYEESDWDFLSHLLTSNGLYFKFSHEAEKECLVIIDDWATSAVLQKNENGDPCDAQPLQIPYRGADESILAFNESRSLVVGHVEYNAFNWTAPALLASGAPIDNDNSKAVPSIYHPAGVSLYEYSTGGSDSSSPHTYARDDATAQAQLACAREQVKSYEGTYGASNACKFSPGVAFCVPQGLPASSHSVWVLLSVTHEGGDTSVDQAEYEHSYTNQFTCFPGSLAYAPKQLTIRRALPSTLNALVVGPPGEEVWTDKHARVQLQFPWEAGAPNDTSRAWVRVAQSASGKGLGTLFVPHVGTEVLVSFLHGDGGSPVIVGSVYNGQSSPPANLPSQKTRSVWRSETLYWAPDRKEIIGELVKFFELNKGFKRNIALACLENAKNLSSRRVGRALFSNCLNFDAPRAAILNLHRILKPRMKKFRSGVVLGVSCALRLPGFNEIKLESAPGVEGITIHGHQAVGVSSTGSVNVSAGRKITTESIGRENWNLADDQSFILGSVTRHIGDNLRDFVLGNVEENCSGNKKLFVKGNVSAEVQKATDISTQGNVGFKTHGNLSQHIDGNVDIKTRGNISHSAEKDMNQIIQGNLTQNTSGDCISQVRGDYLQTVDGKSEVNLHQCDLTADGAVNINAKNQDITISGKTITLSASDKIVFRQGDASIMMVAGNIVVSGEKYKTYSKTTTKHSSKQVFYIKGKKIGLN